MRSLVLDKEMIRYFLKCKAEAYRSYSITEQLESHQELSPTRNQIACELYLW